MFAVGEMAITSAMMVISTIVPPTLAIKGHSHRIATTVVFWKRKACAVPRGRCCLEKGPPISEPWGVAHELSNDLCVILKRCELLESLVKDPEMAKHLHLIREAAHHMADTIAQASMSARLRTTHRISS